MTDIREESIFYNALNLFLKTDFSRLGKALKDHGSWKAAWEALPEADRESFKPEKEMQNLVDRHVSLVVREDPNYPHLLKEISHPPFGLYVLGELDPQPNLPLAMVGTRNATMEGKELAKQFAHDLGGAQFTIISGLALGIDSAAHRGALDAGARTVAVLGTGLDRVYPATNTSLAEQIVRQGGALVSEYPLGSPSLPHRFIERNRLISGLSRGVLVIEAPARSGTLATARFALDQNRDVFVIPGPVHHPNFVGSHNLIKQGASLVTELQDIAETYHVDLAPPSPTENLSKEEEQILTILKKSAKPLSIDKLMSLSKLSAAVVNQTITFLTIKKLIKETTEGYAI